MPIAALAVKCHVSERTLHRAFQTTYGCGPRQALRAVRLRGVLVRTGIPRAVGEDLSPYVDYSHFFREFVALTGLRPSQVQALRQQGSPDPDCLNDT
jgi:AraC-like DNA-binding protein